MKIQNEQTIGQIVDGDYRTAAVFREFGLDFCCGGSRTIDEAAGANGVRAEDVKQILGNLDSDSTQHNA